MKTRIVNSTIGNSLAVSKSFFNSAAQNSALRVRERASEAG